MQCFICGGQVQCPVEFDCGFVALACDLCLSGHTLGEIMAVVEARHALAALGFFCDCSVMAPTYDDNQDPS